MTPSENSFVHLIERARNGDQEALERLVRQYEAEVRVVAHGMLGPALRPYLDSVDLVQSVHRTVMLGLRRDKFDISTPEHLRALALTMLRRKVARHWRKARRQRRLSGDSGHRAEHSQVLSSLCAPVSDPARHAEVNEQIERFLDRLSTTERSLVELRLEGRTTAEAARELKLDPDVLRVRLSRLRRRLLDQGWDDDWL